MSGGHFDYKEYNLRMMADTIREEIALALKPKPDIIHEDYWIIEVHDSPTSSYSYRGHMQFDSYEEAEELLCRMRNVEHATKDYPIPLNFIDEVVFQSTDTEMKGVPEGVKVPVLYSIHHCIYDRYPYDVDVLELKEETIETMKGIYKQLRIAEIQVHALDYVLSGDSAEKDLQEDILNETKKLEVELKNIDWSVFGNE